MNGVTGARQLSDTAGKGNRCRRQSLDYRISERCSTGNGNQQRWLSGELEARQSCRRRWAWRCRWKHGQRTGKIDPARRREGSTGLGSWRRVETATVRLRGSIGVRAFGQLTPNLDGGRREKREHGNEAWVSGGEQQQR